MRVVELIGAMTWPINVAEELRDAQLLGELKQSIDYTTLTNAQLSYKADILRNGSLRQMMNILGNSLGKNRRWAFLAQRTLSNVCWSSWMRNVTQGENTKGWEYHLAHSTHVQEFGSDSRSSFNLWICRRNRTIFTSSQSLLLVPLDVVQIWRDHEENSRSWSLSWNLKTSCNSYSRWQLKQIHQITLLGTWSYWISYISYSEVSNPMNWWCPFKRYVEFSFKSSSREFRWFEGSVGIQIEGNRLRDMLDLEARQGNDLFGLKGSRHSRFGTTIAVQSNVSSSPTHPRRVPCWAPLESTEWKEVHLAQTVDVGGRSWKNDG